MQELINIKNDVIGSKVVNTVNARELYEALEIKQQFGNWIVSQIKRAGLAENIDYIRKNVKVKAGGGTSTKIEYFITANSSKHIAMMSQGEKAQDVRDYFIAIEESHFKALESSKGHITGGYKSQISQKNSKIKELEQKVLMLESGFDKKIDYRLKAKALYPVILSRIDQIEDELVKEFSGKSLELYAKKLDEIKLLLSREARVCKFMTFLGNGTAINNTIVEDDTKKLSLK